MSRLVALDQDLIEESLQHSKISRYLSSLHEYRFRPRADSAQRVLRQERAL